MRVRVTPKSTKTKVEGVGATADGPAILIKVRAVPEDGAANAAVTEVLADLAGVARRSVELHSGARSRVKSFRIAGEPDAIVARLAAHLAARATGA